MTKRSPWEAWRSERAFGPVLSASGELMEDLAEEYFIELNRGRIVLILHDFLDQIKEGAL